MRNLQIMKVSMYDIKPDAKNARRHDERNIEEIKRSLEAHEQYAPLIVQRQTGKILVGNGRYEAMKQLGWDTAQVVYIDCNNKEAAKIALTDNRTAELGEWDFAVLKDVLQDLGPEPDVAGWTDAEIENLFDLEGWNGETEISEDAGDSETELLKCPCCGHVNEKKAFKNA
ncbi:MAG: ParB N-terminal domain-containing protein [Synergistaceae bacterium]|nr:ParB N-terminal domain-containing protein [Synergistaceae bacterium]